MTERNYLEIVWRRRLLVVLATLLTLLMTWLLTAFEPATYRSAASFVVRPASAGTEQETRALDTLVRGVQINATYAALARSDVVRKRAASRAEVKASDLAVTSDVVTGTNIIELAVTGPEPARVGAFAAALAVETAANVQRLGGLHELAVLDPPQDPATPVPSKRLLTILTGGLVGVVLGVCMAVIAEALARRRSGDAVAALGSGDAEAVRAVHQRFADAMKTGDPFSLALLAATSRPLNGAPESEMVTKVSRAVPSPGGQAAAYLGDGTFALVVEGDADHANDVLDEWIRAIQTSANGDLPRTWKKRMLTPFHPGNGIAPASAPDAERKSA